MEIDLKGSEVETMETNYSSTTVLLVRHAQARSADGSYGLDTLLSGLGRRQAEAVAVVLTKDFCSLFIRRLFNQFVRNLFYCPIPSEFDGVSLWVVFGDDSTYYCQLYLAQWRRFCQTLFSLLFLSQRSILSCD